MILHLNNKHQMNERDKYFCVMYTTKTELLFCLKTEERFVRSEFAW